MFDMIFYVKSKEEVQPQGTFNIRLAPSLDLLQAGAQAQMEIKLSNLTADIAAKYELGKELSIQGKVHF